jgi:hypothetical protein
MSEAHNNTIPGKRGSYNISQSGIVYFFPIQDAAFLKPFLGLMLYQRADGEIFISIDERWVGLQQGMDE